VILKSTTESDCTGHVFFLFALSVLILKFWQCELSLQTRFVYVTVQSVVSVVTVAVCCSMLWCVTASDSRCLGCSAVCTQCVAGFCSVLQCVAALDSHCVNCSVLFQCVDLEYRSRAK